MHHNVLKLKKHNTIQQTRFNFLIPMFFCLFYNRHPIKLGISLQALLLLTVLRTNICSRFSSSKNLSFDYQIIKLSKNTACKIQRKYIITLLNLYIFFNQTLKIYGVLSFHEIIQIHNKYTILIHFYNNCNFTLKKRVKR